jgi:hypothetical protein
MPIRFRCRDCGQLLGIARRKAGAEVACPNCAKKLTVPSVDDPDLSPPADAPAAAAAANRGNPFERSDFDIELKPPPREPARAAPAPPPRPAPPLRPAPPAPLPAPVAREIDSMRPPSVSGPPVGVVLSPTLATVLTVAAILLLGLAFAAGLLVGRMLPS